MKSLVSSSLGLMLVLSANVNAFSIDIGVIVDTNTTHNIDIDARVNDQNNPINVFLKAGTYSVNVVDGKFKAWTAWNVNQLNCNDVSGCTQTSPTTNTGWFTDYFITSDYLTSVSVNGVALTAVNAQPQTLGSYFLKSSETYFKYDDAMVYSTASAALAAAVSVTFTLSQDSNVAFNIVDAPITDNSGGVSLSVQEVPVPAAVWLFGSALLGLYSKRK